MAIIDTLKLARALRDSGGFTQDAAEATAEALDAALGDATATKSDVAAVETSLHHEISALESTLRHEINRVADAAQAALEKVKAELKSDIRLLQWQMGIMYVLQIAILIKLFVH